MKLVHEAGVTAGETAAKIMNTENQTRKEVLRTRNITVLNRSTVKAYALKVSKEKRAGRFTRVSEEFLLGCEAELEADIRRYGPVEYVNFPRPDPDAVFLTRVSRQRLEEKFEERALRIIHGRVMRHPSLGITLKD